MPGGLLNIVSYGNQNVILNGNPKKTFFKSVYMKYTNFGIQKFRIDYDGARDLDPNQDSVYSFKIPRSAELLLDSYLVFRLPDIWSPILPPTSSGDVWKPYHFRWIQNLGTSIIKDVKVIIGSQVIQEYPGEYIRCIVERDFNESKKKMFNNMTGNLEELNRPEYYGQTRNNNYPNAFFNTSINGSEPSIRGRQIYVPLNPWFMNNTKTSLPLVCLQYSEVVIQVTLRPIREIFTINNIDGIRVITSDDTGGVDYDYYVDYNSNLRNLYQSIQPNFSTETHQLYNFLQPPPTIELDRADYKDKTNNWNADVHLISNMCFLTTEESRTFALNNQEILIKDIKYSKFYNIAGTARVRIDSNALVSSWMWFYRRSDAYKRNQWSNYTNWLISNKVPYILQAGEKETPYILESKKIGPGRDLSVSSLVGTISTNHRVTPNFSSEYNKNILEKFSIIMDGKYRENEFDAGVYEYIEKYRCSTGSNDTSIYYYNFCLNTSPSDTQPSGAMNLGRFKKIEMEMTTIFPTVNPDNVNTTLCDEDGGIIGVIQADDMYLYDFEMHLFEERYNIVRFMSGNAGLLFAR